MKRGWLEFVGLAASLLLGCSVESQVQDASPMLPGVLTSIDSDAHVAQLSAGSPEIYFLSRSHSDTDLFDNCVFAPSSRYASTYQVASQLHAASQLHVGSHDPESGVLGWQEWVDLTLGADRVFWSGALREYPNIVHPQTGAAGVVAWRIDALALPAAEPSLTDLVGQFQRLKACAPAVADRLVYVPDRKTIHDRLVNDVSDPDEAGMVWVPAASVAAEIAAVPGEAFGYLVVDPPDGARLEATDIVMSEHALAGDFAGLISAAHATQSSMIGPHAIAPALWSSAESRALAGQLVRLRVTDDGIFLESASPEAALDFWASRSAESPAALLGERTLRPVDELALSDAPAYGARAAGTGQAVAALPADARIHATAVPFTYFADRAAELGSHPVFAASFGTTDLSWLASRTARDAALDEVQHTLMAPADTSLSEALLEQLVDAPDWRTVAHQTDWLRIVASPNIALPAAVGPLAEVACLADDLDGDSMGPSRCLSDEDRLVFEQLLDDLGSSPAELERRSLIERRLGDEFPVSDAIGRLWARSYSPQNWAQRAVAGHAARPVFQGLMVFRASATPRISGSIAISGDSLEPTVFVDLPGFDRWSTTSTTALLSAEQLQSLRDIVTALAADFSIGANRSRAEFAVTSDGTVVVEGVVP